MSDQNDNESFERAWERETFTLTPEQIREYAQRDARAAQTLPDMSFDEPVLIANSMIYDMEGRQLAAWDTLRASAIEDAKDKRIAELEAALRVTRLERDALKETSDPLHKIIERKTLHIGLLADRITLLEGALQSFASAAYDEDIVNGNSTDPLYSARATDGDNDSDVAIVYRTDNYQPLTVGDLRRACEVLLRNPAPTASESEADDDDNE